MDEEQQRSPVREYHNATKHAPTRLAPGPRRMDWATQPEPFRRFPGTWQIALPLARGDDMAELFGAVRKPRRIPARSMDLKAVAALLEYSLGIAAWKEQQGTRWALRCNPSSGNLHAEEAYLLCPGIQGLSAGVYHYVPVDHALEQRAMPADPEAWRKAFPGGGVILGLSTLYWREAWKYGARAYRYCQLDIGHAVAAVRYAAAALGWSVRMMDGFGDGQIARLLGLDRRDDFPGEPEREAPEVLLWCTRSGPAEEHPDTTDDPINPEEPAMPDPTRLYELAASLAFRGRADPASPAHVDWPGIQSAHQATRKPPTDPLSESDPLSFLRPQIPRPAVDLPVGVLFRKRRSGVEYDGVTGTTAPAFFTILDALLPRPEGPPWDALPWLPKIHPLFFVHRVKGLEPGLYLLARTEAGARVIRANLGGEMEFARVETAPSHLPLYTLVRDDYRRFAAVVSCGQSIAADSVFAVSMVAEFNAALDRGPWFYRWLHWEAGMLGQVLYLEAEAAGLRGTGIGCFFDDMMHELLGITTSALQVLYHFTVGGPLEDERLVTHPPYAHLDSR